MGLKTFPYYGGKTALTPRIAALLPRDERSESYVEAFGGSASLLACLDPPFPLETYNDLDGGCVNFFRQLRDAPEELERLCGHTPYAREEFRHCLEVDLSQGVEGARAFLFLQAATWAGKPPSQPSNFTVGHNARCFKRRPESWQIIVSRIPDLAKRLSRVQIECLDCLALLDRYDQPKAVFYLDPPYLPDVRETSGKTDYRCEMSRAHHVALAARLHRMEGRALISGYQSKLYDRLYHGWERRLVGKPYASSGASPDSARKDADRREEYVWANYPLPPEGAV